MNSSHGADRFSYVVSDSAQDRDDFGVEVARGLGAQPKRLPCRFFYDAVGSALFEQICELPEYYVTRAEREILETQADAIAGVFDVPVTLAELGSGSSEKTRLLIEAFLRRQGALRYVPVDISRSILEETSQVLLDEYRGLEIFAIATEYREGLQRVSQETHRPKVIAWLGSNVGNFDRAEAARFVSRIREAMASQDRLLLGVDLRKSRSTLERAYDDAQGITARFNMNLLVRINRELGGHFDPERFEHRSVWHEAEGRVAMELVSRCDQEVEIEGLGMVVKFNHGEAIHTEDSYKYSLAEIDALAQAADLRLTQRWLDARQRFSLTLMAPA